MAIHYTTPDYGDTSAFTQDDLDPKALNCVGWHLANAFCQWDGGRLASSDEIRKAYTNNGASVWPWGNSPGWGSAESYDYVNWNFNYGFPGDLPLNNEGNVFDVSWYVSPPGRFAPGNNWNGVADAAGGLLVWDNNTPRGFVWTGDWDNHASSDAPDIWGYEPNGYFSIGIRCAHD
ncbi:MAG: hypothetical protein FWD69_02990 [Polyangiaceae bacterium]|nr:hypothetical protein [Polyangiaceae bacterium]